MNCLLIRGWVNYYRFSAASKTYEYIQHRIIQTLLKWTKRRHPKKLAKWRVFRYFHHSNRRKWDLTSNSFVLCNPTDTKIKKYIKVRGNASPYDPTLKDYWNKRSRFYQQIF